MGNERDHSLMGRLFSKVRGSLNASSVEMLVLGHHYILRELLSSKARIASQLATGVDPQQIEDEFEERMQGIFLAIAAADDSDSD